MGVKYASENEKKQLKYFFLSIFFVILVVY